MTPRERRRLYVLMVGVVLAACVDVLGVASVIPFLTLVADPTAIDRVPLLASARAWLGIDSNSRFLVVAGFAALAIILLNSLLNALLTWAQLLYGHLVGFNFSRRLLRVYLARDHRFFASRNSAEMSKNVLAEGDRIVSGVINPALLLVSRAIAAAAITLLLLFVNPLLALVLAVGFGGIYFGIYFFMKGRLHRLGQASFRDNERRFRTVTESFSTLDELRLYGRTLEFAGRYDLPARRYAEANAASLVIGQTPRFVLEPLAFGSIILILVFSLLQGADVGDLLPVLGLFAYAGSRLMPAFQNMFIALSNLRFSLPAAQAIADMLRDEASYIDRFQARRTQGALPFSRAISLESVSMVFGTDGRVGLESIDLEIKANSVIGLVGRTGAGKSTLAGVIAGLLRPTSGRVLIDGRVLDDETVPLWQSHIGYVPQSIVLIDDSIAANIALGIPTDQIDMAAVERAARVAGIHDFIIGELPEGYASQAGERGSRISGGQRQRIGIARALYHDPDVIIFDEATSALDSETEQAVMRALESLAGKRTLIMIAHRLTTLRHADVVLLMEEGRITASGKLDEVAARLGGVLP